MRQLCLFNYQNYLNLPTLQLYKYNFNHLKVNKLFLASSSSSTSLTNKEMYHYINFRVDCSER